MYSRGGIISIRVLNCKLRALLAQKKNTYYTYEQLAKLVGPDGDFFSDSSLLICGLSYSRSGMLGILYLMWGYSDETWTTFYFESESDVA